MITRALLSLFGLIVTSAAFAADIYILGESHDNPAHHQTQAAWISDIKPKAVVFEMLEPGQERAIAMLRDRTPQAMRDVTRWDQSGWPEFDLYKPIFWHWVTFRSWGLACRANRRARRLIEVFLTHSAKMQTFMG